MFKNIRHFFREYKQFGLVVLAFIAGLGLYLTDQDTVAGWVLGVTAILNVIPLLWGMWQDLRNGKYGIDILAATAIVTSVVLGEYIAGMIIVLMLTGGEALEDYAENRAKVELDALLDRAPKLAHRLNGRKETDIRVTEVALNDKLVVKPGEVIPVDSIVLEGITTIDESSLTGESLPVDKKPGDQLLSGAVNMDGAIVVRALATAEDSQYQQIIKLVKNAASTESPFVRLTDRYAIPFTVLSFGIAISVWVISGDPMRFLQVIVVATPCPLLLAAPIALISGMSRAAKHGIIVKSGAAFERLAQVRTFGFDKTGTLTEGRPVVDTVTTFGSFKQDEVLAAAASLEQNSNHVLAQALANEAAKKKLTVLKAKQLQETPGYGLAASVNGKKVVVGKLVFLTDSGIDLPKSLKIAAPKSTATYVAIGGKLAGVVSFRDAIRSDSKHMLERIRSLGARDTLMVTGDNKAAAAAVAKQLGITSYIAEALPGDKIRAVEAAKHRPVAFVGDGVNDAPVLTAADVGIALGARGATAASESADVVIMTDDINQVARSYEISKKTFSIAQQAIVIGIGMSVVMQLVFATGRFSASLGAALQEVVDVTVIFLALRAHGSFRRPKPADKKLQQA